MTEDAMRKAFEAWANVSMPHAPNFRRASSGEYTKQGDYSDWGIGYAWLAWQAATRAAAPAWLPIASAPKEGRVLLLGRYGPFIGIWGQYDVFNQPRITHWMPVPPPPAAPEAKP